MRVRICGVGLAIAFVLSAVSAARADTMHIVARGHTIEAIAHRYRVSEKAIIEANHLSDPGHLTPGQVLVIPGVEAAKKRHPRASQGSEAKTEGAAHAGARGAKAESTHTASRSNARAPAEGQEGQDSAEGDTVHARHLGAEFDVRTKDAGGHVPASALKAFERMMGERGATHAIDPRLIARIGIVSSHFGGKTIDVVSGYHAADGGPARHSNHSDGKAIDFRVRGVDSETLSEFCRTLQKSGCGFYPNGSFVHLDVRDSKAYWVDWSRAGEGAGGGEPVRAAEEVARASGGGGAAPNAAVPDTGVHETHPGGSPVTSP